MDDSSSPFRNGLAVSVLESRDEAILVSAEVQKACTASLRSFFHTAPMGAVSLCSRTAAIQRIAPVMMRSGKATWVHYRWPCANI